ncbi:putative uncharacterized protein C3orf49 homolog [Eptesicus fuscus]|uniref:putative uncharacterized protein C3orf49 homolog n=1 Tax=Eptesicus fuscus TaxID=29078 RepID=UPI002404448C|nr:putative uncharacterized protein C3orf49 homolog [Eptesicus fuscus]
MDRPQLHRPESVKFSYGRVGQYRRFQQPRGRNSLFKRKGIERWHRAVSPNLVKQNVLVPKEESSSGSDMEFHGSQQSQRKSVMRKVKTFVGRMLSPRHRHKPAGSGATSPQDALLPHPQSLLPGGAQELPPPRLLSTRRTRKLSQNAALQLDVVEAETEEITRGSTLLRARTTRRLSVTSLPAGPHKVPYSSKKRPHFPALKKKKHGTKNILRKPDLTVGKLQMQVDDLIETVTDKSMKLLAQRHAELQQCEFLGDEILQSSKQFQRISKRTMRKYKLKNVCFPCTCCCF